MPDRGRALGLVAAVAMLAAAGRRAGLPDPIVFALGGLALALVPGIPCLALPPALALLVFLPPLIFAAAHDVSWAELRQGARPIVLLAAGLVLVSMAAVAVVAHTLAPELSWAAAFTLGAIVAPPDAVAAKAIADTLHLPRRLGAILEGEGLVSDATAFGAFQVASGLAIAGRAFAPVSATLRLGYAAATGIALGVGVGWIGHQTLGILEGAHERRCVIHAVDAPEKDGSILRDVESGHLVGRPYGSTPAPSLHVPLRAWGTSGHIPTPFCAHE